MNSVRLKKCGERYEFESEATLEDFVWDHLPLLFGFTPLARQYAISGLFCDLLAMNSERQLIVIELKNTEDRYIVQQLTRYYDRLAKSQPFSEMVDYNKPILLIGIAPNFHEDNYIDCKYHKLSISLLPFRVVDSQNALFLQISDLNQSKICRQEIPYLAAENLIEVPAPRRKLTNFLSKSRQHDEQSISTILKIREKLLTFDKQIEEIVKPNKILYGKNEKLICAEFYFGGPFTGQEDALSLFLSLPEPSAYRKRRSILRMFVDSRDWVSFKEVRFYPRAFITDDVRMWEGFNFNYFIQSVEKWYQEDPENEGYRNCYQNYKRLIEGKTNSVEALIDIALENLA